MIRENVKVELEDIGEGFEGDYDKTDPNDQPLLRFYVYQKGEDGEWAEVDNASYCTRLPSTLSNAEQIRAEEILMEHVFEPLSKGESIKKLCERLSWIAPDWLKKGVK